MAVSVTTTSQSLTPRRKTRAGIRHKLRVSMPDNLLAEARNKPVTEPRYGLDMKYRTLVILATPIYIAIAASSAVAHHSHPYFYDQCKSVTIEGLVESVQWKDPHALVVVKLDDGTSYTVDWMGLVGLTRNRILGPAQAALVPGARVLVSGSPIRTTAEIRGRFPDFTREVNPRTIDPKLIRRVGDSFSWAQSPVPNPSTCAGK